ncbi:hypothetical protein niasHS_012184 [Heterodera schachtii]|uniref:Uncharacterized protein n=1 Tax=Heterodera schachtii TaxID=97005 RepID=A0ABD2IVX1_HETSC
MGPMDSGRACAMDKSEKSQRTSDSAWAECLQPKEEKPPDESRALTTPDESLPSVPPSFGRPTFERRRSRSTGEQQNTRADKLWAQQRHDLK